MSILCGGGGHSDNGEKQQAENYFFHNLIL
jgi:hypothetical protein